MANLLIPAPGGAPRLCYGWDGTDWRAMLLDAAGNLQVDVAASALPTGAATAAHQVTQNTSLALIEKLEKALESVATDRLQVRGEDQLFSFDVAISEKRTAAISAAGGFIATIAVPAGKIWLLTTIVVKDITSATTSHGYTVFDTVDLIEFYRETSAFGAGVGSYWGGQLYMNAGDKVYVYLSGGLVGDSCQIHYTGYQMTVET